MTGTRSSDPPLSHILNQLKESYSSPATTSSRPIRGARLAAQRNILAYHEDSDEEDLDLDADGEDMLGIFEEAQPVYPEEGGRTRSGRAVRPPAKFKGEDDFEDRMQETSPVVRESKRNGGRFRGRVKDPDEEDGEEEIEVESVPRKSTRNSFPGRSTRNSLGSGSMGNAGPSYTNGTNKRSRSKREDAQVKADKSRHSSADAESFEPSGDETEGEVSEDPLHRAFGDDEEDDDDLESRSVSPPRRATRLSARGPVRRSTRKSARADSDQDKPVRQLRQRTSKINYELPPLDLSAEMQDTISGAARPGGRGIRFATATGRKGLPWTTKGRDMAQAMGVPDTSDSVGRSLLAGAVLVRD